MSSILEGLYKEEEQSAESELRRKLEKVESILGRSTDRNGRQFNQAIQDITKNIKYLEQDELVFEIYSKMRGMAEAIGMDVSDGSPYDDEEDAVREAFNNLEAVVYNMEEPFEDYVRGLQTEVEELELDEGMYDQEAFDNIFKDRKDKGTMERPKARPTRPKPKDTGMYNQPNKADKDKEGEQLTEAQFDEAAGEKDACYHKVKSRYKVWPSAYASGALVKCRKVGAKNWGKTTTKEDEELDEAGTNCWKGYEKKGTKKMFGKTVNNCVKKESVEAVDEDLKAWFGKGKDGGAGGGGWDAYDGSGNRTGKCGDSKGKAKPKCLSKSKAASLRSSGGKKAIGAAVKKKRRNDPNKNRKGKAKNVSSKTNESRILQGLTEGLNTPTPFQIVQDVYKNKQHQKIDGVVMDLFTASALVNAYDQINDANKKKMENADIAMLGKMASKIFELSESMELEEGNGNIRMGILGMLLVSGIWQIDRNMAEKIWDNSHQLQQLTQVYAKANECGDKEKMKDVKRRIANHKTRLDIGKGDVDFDGLPGNDDIKDIGYATQSCDIR
jgi:hypothetical protein|tara:strand:- start:144 stop:1808 length:1665 start_codon:yes stop_codon:yes gene_type:complete